MYPLRTKRGLLATDDNLHFAYRALAHNRKSDHPDAPKCAAACEDSIRDILEAQRDAGVKVSFNEVTASIHGVEPVTLAPVVQ